MGQITLGYNTITTCNFFANTIHYIPHCFDSYCKPIDENTYEWLMLEDDWGKCLNESLYGLALLHLHCSWSILDLNWVLINRIDPVSVLILIHLHFFHCLSSNPLWLDGLMAGKWAIDDVNFALCNLCTQCMLYIHESFIVWFQNNSRVPGPWWKQGCYH